MGQANYVTVDRRSDDEVNLKLDDEEIFNLRHFEDDHGDFFGLYWDTDLSEREFFREVNSLVASITGDRDTEGYTKGLEEIFINGVLYLDYDHEVNLTDEELTTVFSQSGGVDTDERSGIYDVLSNVKGGEFDNREPITFARINTAYFNIGWEKHNSRTTIGVLSHYKPTEPLITFSLDSTPRVSEAAVDYATIEDEVGSILESETGDYTDEWV